MRFITQTFASVADDHDRLRSGGNGGYLETVRWKRTRGSGGMGA